MKILLFTLEYPPFHGGVANYYGNLVKYWPREGGIEVLNNNHGELINSRLPLGWLKAVIKLRRAIKEKGFDHILVGQILPLGTAALIYSKLYKIKYSVFLHGMDFTLAVKPGRKRFMSRRALFGSEKIICANGYLAELAKREFPGLASKIIVVNPGVENRVTHSAQRVAQLKIKYNLDNKIILLSVGRLVKRKGFDKVIEAMPEVLKQAPNLVYVIIGEGPELSNYQLSIKNYRPGPACPVGRADQPWADGLKDKIIIINQTTDAERDQWYNASDIFIMPSRNINGDFEGFGIVYLEANLAGKPVIAGRSGGVGDAVIDGLNGLMVDPENVNDIREKIIKLALNPELRHKLGEQGRRRVIEEFNWKKQVNKIYKITQL